MVYQPPAGARDLLPLDVAQKHWIETRLEQVFQRWGYHRIITSTVESLDTLMAGGAINRETVIELRSAPEGELGLRPELTASIARTAVTRLARVTYPQRLYYSANVFRRADRGSHGGQQESYQCGAELLGAGSAWADAEVLLLIADCLNSLGLDQWQLMLGDAGLTRSLLAVFPSGVREPVREAIAHLDRVALEHLSLSDELRQRALTLLDLRGRPEDILQQTSTLNLSAPEREQVNRLKTLIALLRDVTNRPEESSPQLPDIVLDLSLIQTFDYYTGLTFEVAHRTDQSCQVLGQGGRYDNLLGVFHPQHQGFPGIGFSLSVEALHQVLLQGSQLPTETEPTEWLVVPLQPEAAAAAFAYARTIRTATSLVRVEVQLSCAQDRDQIKAIAATRRIRRIAWISADGLPEIETLA
ncbi:ATP phosphoribosyltransferase regulatory subunit [filamentous cyanobacterium CCP5]|nr:ATP phosphoribosyltransferase regulatory subunit [filamentous cyanobacterium CCP5]